MDALTDALDMLHLKSGLYCRAHLSAPWGLNFSSVCNAVFHVVERGNCWLYIGDADPIALTGGDFLVLPHGNAHQITDAPTTPAQIVIEMGETIPLEYQTLDYTSGDVYTSLLCGTFQLEHSQAHPLLSLLPPLLHIHGDRGQTVEWLDSTLKFFASEVNAHRPGAEIIIKRLADILLIKVIRFWVDSQENSKSGWLGALRDQQVSEALAFMHRYPNRPWSVELLAREVAMSRSAFSARFSALVGLPPLHYLTAWRMQMVAMHLKRGERNLKEMAHSVGYESEFALSKAFKRHFGIAPSDYRRLHIV